MYWGIITGGACGALQRGWSQNLVADGRRGARPSGPAAQAAGRDRCDNEPATLNQVAGSGRPRRAGGQPRGRRLVRAGLVDAQPDPDNRRRLALRLTEAGREQLASAARRRTSRSRGALEQLAHSELRAIERAIEILERGLAVSRCSRACGGFPSPSWPLRCGCANGRSPSFLPPLSCLLTVAPGALFGFLLGNAALLVTFLDMVGLAFLLGCVRATGHD